MKKSNEPVIVKVISEVTGFPETGTKKKVMFEMFNKGYTSDDFEQNSDMYYAMYAYEEYGDATRDNSFDDLVALGKQLEENGGQ